MQYHRIETKASLYEQQWSPIMHSTHRKRRPDPTTLYEVLQ